MKPRKIHLVMEVETVQRGLFESDDEYEYPRCAFTSREDAVEYARILTEQTNGRTEYRVYEGEEPILFDHVPTGEEIRQSENKRED